MKKMILPVLLFSFSIIFPQTDSTLILSEVMFYPQSGPNEFIELYNYSETESIDLDSFKIKYYTSNPDIIVEAGEGTVLQPKSFAIILEGDYVIGSGIYDGLIPPEALVLKISDNSFGTNGMANTTSRPIWLINTVNDTLESYFYSADNSQTHSDEKIILVKDSSQSNWANSLVTDGTPGFQNSVTPVQFDLQMASLTFQPATPLEGDDVTISAKVKNIGTSAADIYTIEIYNDANFDSTADPGELIFSQQYTNLLTGDSVTVSTVMNSLTAGNYQIISRVVFAPDENLLNNELIESFLVFPPGNNYNDIVINEIMYAPSTGEPEWVELFNNTNQSINLGGWRFADTTSGVILGPPVGPVLGPNDFIILSASESIYNFYNIPVEVLVLNLPSLNNSGDPGRQIQRAVRPVAISRP
ncbi:MAG: lamin tail domain-containing protein [Ignavibacteriaceae bacterium]|nr:lamin tail domain-containing protein [Ignavibacteriaceae bacterium]